MMKSHTEGLESTARRLSRQAGMTLLEIMIVLAIIGTLMAFLIGPKILNSFKQSQIQNTKILLNQYNQAVIEWKTRNTQADCPATLDELYQQKFVNAKPVDTWGQPLVYRCPGQASGEGYDLLSKGPDRQEGSADDVKGWE
ncbi:MAG TPA: type II secretion system protein GspG [Polyangia bacterium]|jgi:general secretion pathway protein G